MLDLMFVWLFGTTTIFLVGLVPLFTETLMSWRDADPGILRFGLALVFLGWLWPLALPVFIVLAIVRAFRYAELGSLLSKDK